MDFRSCNQCVHVLTVILSMGGDALGYAACVVAVLFYGSNFVPVKRFEVRRSHRPWPKGVHVTHRTPCDADL